VFSSGHALAPNVPAFGADIRGFNGDEVHGSGIAKTSREKCAHHPIVGLRHSALFCPVWQLWLLLLFSQPPCAVLGLCASQAALVVTMFAVRSALA
jgi:hypothetical protein